MGSAKNQKLRFEERGYGAIAKVACEGCVGDEALKQFVRVGGEERLCDYCKEPALCIDVEALIGEIKAGISFEYERADDWMGAEQGGFIGAHTWDTYDLMYDELRDEMDLHEDLLSDVVQTMNDIIWCKKDPYQMRPSEEYVSIWQDFSQMVKTRNRYTFFRMPENDGNAHSPFFILDHIGEEVERLKLIKTYPAGTQFFRGRVHSSELEICCEHELSSPPHELAGASRMSAQGISIFYGAGDALTAITEIYDPQFDAATSVSFVNLENFQILDLTQISQTPIPSLFDEERRSHREPLKFLYELNENLTRPIGRQERIEYVPAQIIAEYFRFLFTHDGKPVDGIKYSSSKAKNGVCYALFFDQRQCLEAQEPSIFLEHKQMLKMQSETLQRYMVTPEGKFAPV